MKKYIALLLAFVLVCGAFIGCSNPFITSKVVKVTQKPSDETEAPGVTENPTDLPDNPGETGDVEETEDPSETEAPAKSDEPQVTEAPKKTNNPKETAKVTEAQKVTTAPSGSGKTTQSPTAAPTKAPTAAPTKAPTAKPTNQPTATADTEKAKEIQKDKEDTSKKYTGSFSSTTGSLGGVDELGRKVEQGTKKSRTVGLFYFVWLGQTLSGPYDNTKILARDPNAYRSEAAWMAAGGGPAPEFHHWGEPLFGYYKSSDLWVIRKHCQMLTDAGVDYICFDYTNAVTYHTAVKAVISVWYEYMQAGWNVPKLCFYTNTNSGSTMNTIYDSYYNSSTLKSKYPNLDKLWFKYEGKPMIIGNSWDSSLRSDVKSYFRIKAAQWPQNSKNEDGIPWMEFGRLLSSNAIYTSNGKTVMNVSVAQHCSSMVMSYAAFYGRSDHLRTWHNGKLDTSANAIQYGYNFQEQWDFALKNDPDMIFVTGWNEWVAQRLNSSQGGVPSDPPIFFCDCATMNASRDTEPMKGGYGDNYYLQLVENIRRYKGSDNRVNVGENTAIRNMSDWNNVPAKYIDYKDDIVSRNTTGYGGIRYTDNSGRNDFTVLKTAKSYTKIYFYAETASNIAESQTNWMTVFINSGSTTNKKWQNQFDFAINLLGKGTIAKWDGTKFVKVGTTEVKIEGNKMFTSIPRSTLGTGSLVDIQFKWADNYKMSSTGVPDVYSFYTSGDAAPIGRLTYVFSNTK